MTTGFHIHLVSDATGETLNSITRACLVQFEEVTAIEHSWTLIRTTGQMQKVLQGIQQNPGLVLYTIVDDKLRNLLVSSCRDLGVTLVPVLDPVMTALAGHFGQTAKGLSGRQHIMDRDYFHRIEAMDYALAHDDGQSAAELRGCRRHPGGRQPLLEDPDLRLSRQSRHQGGQCADRPRLSAAVRALQREEPDGGRPHQGLRGNWCRSARTACR